MTDSLSIRSVCFVLVASFAECACAPSGTPPSEMRPGYEFRPRAAWISTSYADPSPINRFTWFRRTFDLANVPPSFPLYVGADSDAKLLVNGQLVLRKVMRYAVPQITIERLDVAAALRPGRNVIAVLHHNWGVPTFQRSPGGRSGLLIEGPELDSGPAWRWQTAPELAPHTAQIIGLGTQRIRFPVVLDVSLRDERIHDGDYDDSAWNGAVPVTDGPWTHPHLKETPPLVAETALPVGVVAAGGVSPPSDGVPDEAPMSYLAKGGTYTLKPRAAKVEHNGSGTSLSLRSAPSGEDAYVTVDFGRPVHGYPFFEIDAAPKGAVMDLVYNELKTDPRDGTPVLKVDGSFDPERTVGVRYGDRIVTRAGRQRVELPDERTCRYMMITVRNAAQEPVRIGRVGLLDIHHPTPRNGAFSSEDGVLARLIELMHDHARVTMSDTYVDTPGREDAQWVEDVRLRAVLAAQWYADRTLRQVLLRHHAEMQTPEGLFNVFAPNGHSKGRGLDSFDWALSWVGILHDDWMWTGETERVLRYWDALVRFLDACHRTVRADTGLMHTQNFLGDIRVSIEPGPGGAGALLNAWYAEGLAEAIRMADAVGERAQAEAWSARRARLVAGFRAHLLVPSENGIPLHVADAWTPNRGTAGFSQAAQVSAILAGLVPEHTVAPLVDYVLPDPDGSPPLGVARWNNPTYAYRTLRVLSSTGRDARAMRHLRERYAAYLPDGPLPEYFLPGAQPADPTGSHGWAAVPLAWLHDAVLGVELVDPGGGRLTLTPHPGDLQRFEGTTVTPRGPVRVAYDGRAESYAVTLPAGVTASVRLSSGRTFEIGPGLHQLPAR